MQELSQKRRDEGFFCLCFLGGAASLYLVKHFLSHIFSKDFHTELVFILHVIYEIPITNMQLSY